MTERDILGTRRKMAPIEKPAKFLFIAHLPSCAMYGRGLLFADSANLARTMDERINCTHCGGFVSKKTFLAHKRIYYDSTTDQWLKKR